MFCIWKKQIIFARQMHGTVLSHQNCLRNIHVEKRIQISLIFFYLVNLLKPYSSLIIKNWKSNMDCCGREVKPWSPQTRNKIIIILIKRKKLWIRNELTWMLNVSQNVYKNVFRVIGSSRFTCCLTSWKVFLVLQFQRFFLKLSHL